MMSITTSQIKEITVKEIRSLHSLSKKQLNGKVSQYSEYVVKRVWRNMFIYLHENTNESVLLHMVHMYT